MLGTNDQIVIIDSGLSNIASVVNMLRVLKVSPVVSSDPDIIKGADKVILPGVGSFAAGMERLKALGLDQAIKEVVLKREVPVLGICLGMQLLTDRSEESADGSWVAGLGLVSGSTCRIAVPESESRQCKLPHMGWNDLVLRNNDGLYQGEMQKPRFYFVHSYQVLPQDPAHITATTWHGKTEVTASLQKGHVYGVQFHPEKSHRFGLWLMKNFLEISAC